MTPPLDKARGLMALVNAFEAASAEYEHARFDKAICALQNAAVEFARTDLHALVAEVERLRDMEKQLTGLEHKWRTEAAEFSIDKSWRQARAEHADELEVAMKTPPADITI